MAKVEVKSCDCKHPSQDELYGKGNRLHNLGGGKGIVKRRCTVCGKSK